ncbi:suppressor-like protein [Tasmannia lanceolata]|uniref:suppressor-like protein n=1 Tax=Tasmannia lanceolata TaxID=3420 RepID=UPI0040649E05
MEKNPPSSSSFFPNPNSRIPEDAVFYSIYPDSSLSNPPPKPHELSSQHLQILNSISPYLSSYIWQHQPFNLSLSSPNSNPQIPHFHGKTRFGDNLEDEWFIVFLLFEISRQFPSLSIQISDSDGEFLLIECAFSLPRWINPDTSPNRIFIRHGALHIIPKTLIPTTPTLLDSLNFLANGVGETRASDSVQSALNRRISSYPERARENMHQVRVRVPVSIAQVLKHEPCLIALAVEGFYDRDIDSMKYAAKMEKFLSNGREEMVRVLVRMSRAMYAQLMQQTFQAPRCYPMPPRADHVVYMEAELGMKIACGFEMMYQERRQRGVEGKGRAWDAFKESLESNGYFKGLLPGSKEYRVLMDNALEYYKNSSLFSRTSDMMNAPVRRIDEILALPHSVDDFKGSDLPASDDDSWLYGGEDELNSAILERQKEMEMYESQHRKNQKSGEQTGTNHSSNTPLDDFHLGDVAKSMQAFVQKVSSFEGAEVPENRDSKEVEIDMERFIKDIESVMGHLGPEGTTCGADSEEGHTSSSDMDFDESEDGSDPADPNDEDMGDTFMHSYSDALNEELKTTTLKKSFIRANEQSADDNEIQGTSSASKEMEEEFTPVDVDVNLVKSLLDSFSSQQGLPGPASNLLGLMGLQLPQDSNKKK